MIEVKVDVRGLERLQAAIRRVQDSAPRELDGALREGADLVSRAAQVRAPRKTGAMVRSFRTETGGVRALGQAEAHVIVDARKVSRKYPQGYAYPRRIEFGVRPFLRPALAAKLGAVTQVFEKRVVGQGIKQPWEGG